MKVGLIGQGAIGRYAWAQLEKRGHEIGAVIVRPDKIAAAQAARPGPHYVAGAADLPDGLDCALDCAGHQALAQHGPGILARGIDLVTVSVGALADAELFAALDAAARQGNARLYPASGAIGALDALRAARVGGLTSVRYVGRKPPSGWRGSPAEDRIDLDTLTADAATHFTGTARAAATEYPKNANVAAAVALAGIGMDETEVELIADPNVTANIHEIHASGAFGSFEFRISGNSLPDNPRSSALAAMSAVEQVDQKNRLFQC